METKDLKHPLAVKLDNYYGRCNIREGNSGCAYYKQCKCSCAWEDDKRSLSETTGGPYVGELYDKHRILFIGINTADPQKHLYECYSWISGPKSENGRHIDGAVHRIMKLYLGDSTLTSSETREFFAFTNAIKCTVSTKAGKPTSTMRGNCLIKAAYVVDEIRILQPRLIICLGEDQFYHVRNYLFENAVKIDAQLADVVLRLDFESTQAVMIRLYNPGRGYQSIRAAWKKLCKEPPVVLPKAYARFLPARLDAPSQRREIESIAPRVTCVDGHNLLYDYVIEKLLSLSGWRTP
jgi:hypothetical protein